MRIYNFLRQMRYRWNRHLSYIVNFVFLNNLVQKQTFLYFAKSLLTKVNENFYLDFSLIV